jgi:hypothetical protein
VRLLREGATGESDEDGAREQCALGDNDHGKSFLEVKKKERSMMAAHTFKARVRTRPERE